MPFQLACDAATNGDEKLKYVILLEKNVPDASIGEAFGGQAIPPTYYPFPVLYVEKREESQLSRSHSTLLYDA